LIDYGWRLRIAGMTILLIIGEKGIRNARKRGKNSPKHAKNTRPIRGELACLCRFSFGTFVFGRKTRVGNVRLWGVRGVLKKVKKLVKSGCFA